MTVQTFNKVRPLGLYLAAVRWKHVGYGARYLTQDHADIIASKLQPTDITDTSVTLHTNCSSLIIKYILLFTVFIIYVFILISLDINLY